MTASWIGGIVSFAIGSVISYLIYRMNLRILKKEPDKLASFSVVRQLLSAGYLFIVFFLSRRLPWNTMAMLLGAAIGLTVPAVLLAFRLAGMNDSASKNTNAAESDIADKGDDAHG